MIQKTSAVTTTVLGEVKIIGLLLLSALLLGKMHLVSSSNTAGSYAVLMQLLAMLCWVGFVGADKVHVCSVLPISTCAFAQASESSLLSCMLVHQCLVHAASSLYWHRNPVC